MSFVMQWEITNKFASPESFLRICSKKGSELPEGGPDRKFKGRCAVQGNGVKDENPHAAIFQELSSSPATLEAAKSVDAYGCMEGNETQQCDAQQAYVQSELGVLKHGLVFPKFYDLNRGQSTMNPYVHWN